MDECVTIAITLSLYVCSLPRAIELSGKALHRQPRPLPSVEDALVQQLRPCENSPVPDLAKVALHLLDLGLSERCQYLRYLQQPRPRRGFIRCS